MLRKRDILCFREGRDAGKEETDDDGGGDCDFEGGCEHTAQKGSPSGTFGVGKAPASDEFEENGTDPWSDENGKDLGRNEDGKNGAENGAEASSP